MKLTGKIALVTGGNGGIGLAAAQAFVTGGARAIITGRNQAKLSRAASSLGDAALAVRSDILVGADRTELFDRIKSAYGRLDIVFANAGIAKGGSIAVATEDMFDEVLRTNVTAVFLTIQAALPLMSAGGSIIVCGSVAGKAGYFPGAGVYSASKQAVLAMARSMSAELAPKGIRINVLAPGFTDTEFGTAGLDEVSVHERNVALGRKIPVGRLARADEIARGALFLASDDSSFMHGAELVIDGGLSGATFGAEIFR
ncbi:SDR family oxidoreductase [Paraburkholderia solisilvae]|uniref:3-oxoacyl-[acyl-carrier-protein] reductase FabG n=1 Tax=Paraburkholderia solisilvae TaxID=624376 RepID=A0A6J5F0E0_9BURK|nr:SDR family oxidoreductase [Paraburkholderia solisilvae]CAB3771137.1 3-oxoacyl-[acyl-carrier-protein] reductase FabG [Paraburkholderia solisilvae]